MSLGAAWAGGIEAQPPSALEAVIDTTPAWGPVSEALKRLSPGGRLVVNAIRKEAADQGLLAQLVYPAQLWLEKEIKSVANVTRADVRDFLQVATEAGIKPEFQEYEWQDANRALHELKLGRIRGAKVLRIEPCYTRLVLQKYTITAAYYLAFIRNNRFLPSTGFDIESIF